jgi:mono/diheme cytochrome c family protein
MKVLIAKNKPIYLAMVLALASVALASPRKQTQTTPDAQPQSARLIRTVEGPDLFRTYCAPCHGLDAKGAGPAASALKAKVPDLTVLARNNRGHFPTTHVSQMIVGDDIVAAHGSREMPIWGPIFHQIEADMDWGNVRVENLVKYLESIQTSTASNPPTGAELYSQHCAACHGSDLKGGGPAPAPFRTPHDLTRLAQRHGGKFLDAYVADVLRNGVIMPAHGPAQMPIWGVDFAMEGPGKPQAELLITNLTNYIKSRQRK